MSKTKTQVKTEVKAEIETQEIPEIKMQDITLDLKDCEIYGTAKPGKYFHLRSAKGGFQVLGIPYDEKITKRNYEKDEGLSKGHCTASEAINTLEAASDDQVIVGSWRPGISLRTDVKTARSILKIRHESPRGFSGMDFMSLTVYRERMTDEERELLANFRAQKKSKKNK